MIPMLKKIRDHALGVRRKLRKPADYTKEDMTAKEIGVEVLDDLFDRMGWKFDKSKVTVTQSYEKPFGFDPESVAKKITGTMVKAMRGGNVKSVDKKQIAKLMPKIIETTGKVKIQKKVVPVFKVPPVEEIKAQMIVHEIAKKAFPSANISEPVLSNYAKKDIVEAKAGAEKILQDRGITNSVDLIDYVSPEKYSEMAFGSGDVSAILSKRNLLIAGGVLLLVFFVSK